MGSNLSVGLTAPIVGLGVIASKTFSDFEQEMAKVQAVSGAAGKDFTDLKDNALDLGSATQFSAKQVASLQLNLSKLGFSSTEILAATEATIDLAIATGEDLAGSATVAASTIRGFGLTAADTGFVVDVMAKSFSSSALDLEKFKTAMGVLAPVAKTAGESLSSATGYLSILVNAGIDASTAGTGLRNVFLDAAKSGLSFRDALSKINNSANKNITALSLFGKRGATVATVLAENIEKADDLAESYSNSSGAAKQMASIVEDTLEGSMLRLKSSIEGLSISFGKVLAPGIRKVAKYFGGLADSFRELSPETKKSIVVFGAFAAAIGPLLVALGLLMTTVVPGLITSFGYLRASVLLLQTGFIKLTAIIAANPFGALAVAIAAAASYFVFFREETEKTVKTQSLLVQINDTAAKSIVNEKAKLTELLAIAKHEGVSKAQRLKALKEINKISPKYLGHLTLETINTDLARVAVEKYNKQLLETAKVKAAQSKLQQIQSKKIDIEISEAKKLVKDAKKLKQLKADAVTIEDRLRVRTLEKVGYGKVSNGIHAAQLQQLQREEDLLLKIITANKVKNKVVSTGVAVSSGKAKRPTAVGLNHGLKTKGPQATGLGIADGLSEEEKNIDTSLTNINNRFIDFSEQTSNVVSATAVNVLSSFGEMIAGLANGSLSMGDIAGGLMKTIGDLAVQLGKAAIEIGVGMLAIKAAFTNPFTAIAAGIALVAIGTLISSAASITSGNNNYAGAFANGGVVGGNSVVGDKLFARVNSGEMILNQRQQKNLHGMFGAAGGGAVEVNLMPSIDFSGDKFKIMLDRVEKRNARKR
ncbi:TP901 family phage tail tape measure protein [Lutibacter sp. Hel_I_33_5]|nr:TP901 family phage tail tape measure protein [Lutibacter sp. Hel_I_33_5]